MNNYIPYTLLTQKFKNVISFDLVDCEWGNWTIGTCSEKCGGGIQTDTRKKTQVELYDGTPCDGEATRNTTCNANPCPGIGVS